MGKLFRMRDWENADAEIRVVRSGMTRMLFLPSRSLDTNPRERERKSERTASEKYDWGKGLFRGSCSLLIQHGSAIANTCYRGYPEFNQALGSQRTPWPLSPSPFDAMLRNAYGTRSLKSAVDRQQCPYAIFRSAFQTRTPFKQYVNFYRSRFTFHSW